MGTVCVHHASYSIFSLKRRDHKGIKKPIKLFGIVVLSILVGVFFFGLRRYKSTLTFKYDDRNLHFPLLPALVDSFQVVFFLNSALMAMGVLRQQQKQQQQMVINLSYRLNTSHNEKTRMPTIRNYKFCPLH